MSSPQASVDGVKILDDRMSQVDKREDNLTHQFSHLNAEHNRLLATVNRLHSAINQLEESPRSSPTNTRSRVRSPVTTKTTTIRQIRKTSRSPPRRTPSPRVKTITHMELVLHTNHSPKPESKSPSYGTTGTPHQPCTKQVSLIPLKTVGSPSSTTSTTSPFRRSPSKLRTPQLHDLQQDHTRKGPGTMDREGLHTRSEQLHHQVLKLQSQNESITSRLDNLQQTVIDANNYSPPPLTDTRASATGSPSIKLLAPSPRSGPRSSTSSDDIGKAASQRMQSVDVILASYTQLRGNIETLKQEKIQLESALQQISVATSDKERQHTAEVAAAQRRTSDIEAQVLTLSQTVESLHTQKKKADASLREFRAQNQQLQARIDQLQGDLSSTRDTSHHMVDTEAKHIQREADRKQQYLQDQIDSLQIELQGAKQNYQQVEQEFGTYRLKNPEGKFQDVVDENRRLKDREQLESKYTDGQLDEYRRQIERLTASLERSVEQREFDDLLRENTALQTKLSNSREEHAAVCKHLQDKVERLLLGVEQLKTTLAETQSAKATQENEILTLQQDRDSLRKQLHDIKNEKDSKATDLEEQRSTYSSAVKNIERLEAQKKQSDRDFEKLKAEKQDLERMVTNMEEEHELAKQLYDVNAKEAKLMTATCETLTNEKTDIQSQLAKLKMVNDELNHKLATARDTVMYETEKREQYQKEAERLMARLKEIESEKGKLLSEVGDLQGQVQPLQDELDRVTRLKRELQKEFQQLKDTNANKIASLEAHLAWLLKLQQEVQVQITSLSAQV